MGLGRRRDGIGGRNGVVRNSKEVVCRCMNDKRLYVRRRNEGNLVTVDLILGMMCDLTGTHE
jgi:hypothetical protein